MIVAIADWSRNLGLSGSETTMGPLNMYTGSVCPSVKKTGDTERGRERKRGEERRKNLTHDQLSWICPQTVVLGGKTTVH